MTSCITRSNKKQVCTDSHQSQIFQPDSSEEKQIYSIIRLPVSNSSHNGQCGSRSAYQDTINYGIAEKRENIVSNHVKQTSAYSSQHIHPQQMPGSKRAKEQNTEPVKPQHKIGRASCRERV